jgi:outer membrane receptor for ferrienterochelin and colicins
MKKIALLSLLLSPYFLFCQRNATIAGKIMDKESGEALVDVTVSVKGTNVLTASDEWGRFIIRNINKDKVILAISHVGYESKEVMVELVPDTVFLSLVLNVDNRIGNEVVISASKRPEKITNAPASIQVIGTRNLEQFAGSNVFELVSKVQGIEYTRAGVDEITVNARGLNSAFNYKIFEIVDGRNSMASASAGLPLFNNGSTNKDDIERIEIVLGPQSALYGPNAHNGLFNYITKDPRRYQGTSISTSVGSQSQFSTRFRHALKINERWAYKLTGEHATGNDYHWYDTVYVGSIGVPERIKDFGFRRYRGEAHVYYSMTPKTDIIVSGGGSQFTRLQVTTAGHNQLKDVTYGFIQGRVVNRRYFVNVYNTWGNLGKTLLLGNYTRDFWNRTHDTILARRLLPDTAEAYATTRNTVKEKSHRLNAEAQYNYDFKQAGLRLVAGVSFQLDRPNGYGITLIDSFERISITQYGAIVQLDKSLPWNLRLVATSRFDHHSNFGGFLAPRVALLKAVGEGNFRVTWGRAYAMPTIQNQYAGINRSLFGNGGTGIFYIPNGANVKDTGSFLTTTPLVPEEVSTWEMGYNGNLTKKIYVDVNYYNGVSRNFISPQRTVLGRVISVNGIEVTHNPASAGNDRTDTLRNAFFSTFFNYGAVRTYGLDAGVTYVISNTVSLALKYSWFGSDITKDDLKNDANKDTSVTAEEKSMNAPKNRIIGILSFQNLYKRKVFVNLSARYVERYDFYSGNQIGTFLGKGSRGKVEVPGHKPIFKNFDWGPLGDFTTIDIEAGYRFNELVSVNTAVTNLLNTRQIEMVGSPSIGRLFMVEFKLQVPYSKK